MTVSIADDVLSGFARKTAALEELTRPPRKEES